MHHLPWAVALSLLSLASSAPARADLPPPEGTKFVGYEGRVQGLGKFKDFVLVAFPWSMSNGRPTREHLVLEEDKPMEIGRRSPDVVLHAAPRAAWEAFEKTLPNDENARADALAKFFGASPAVTCDLAPERVWTLPTSDPRATVTETFVVDTIDATHCHLVRAPAEGAAAPTTPAPTTPATPATPAAAPTKKASCAGGDADPLGALAPFAALALWTWRRRSFARGAR